MGDSAEQTQAAYLDVMGSSGIDLTMVQVDADGTLVGEEGEPWQLTVDSLPLLQVASEGTVPSTSDDLRLVEKLGEGGMGQVWAATQVTLDRKVAIKRLHGKGERGRAQLLREALVTGSLEHPNIVPVHSLGQTTEGAPLIVMKYIEGRPWRDSMTPLYDRHGELDATDTEAQLGIFMQVCNALSFAHSRGVLHRDLKPDNVMIGRFGEVYLVDWGIAVALRPGGKVPSAKERRALEGTPGYMAPEMATGRGDLLDERSDVYLLGAVLHELVTGEQRHTGKNLIEVLSHAYASLPYDYGPNVPAELAQICNRACAEPKGDRFPSAEALRVAIADFLRHRSSRRLAENARRSLRTFERLFASEDVVEIDEGAFRTASLGARFGFTEALREWPENAEAKAGLDRTLELLVRYDLRHRDVHGAASKLRELTETRPELEQQLLSLEKEIEEEQKHIEELEQGAYQSDLEVGAKIRRENSWLLGIILAVSVGGLFVTRILGIHQAGYPDAMAVMALFTAGVVHGAYRLSKVGGHQANRRLMAGLGVSCASIFALFAMGAYAELDFATSLAIVMLIAAVSSGSMAAMMDARFGRTAVGFLLTAIGVLIWPRYRGAIIAVGSLISLGTANVHFKDAAVKGEAKEERKKKRSVRPPP